MINVSNKSDISWSVVSKINLVVNPTKYKSSVKDSDIDEKTVNLTKDSLFS
jgi:hypothetical protein